jgi:hypothetical protein
VPADYLNWSERCDHLEMPEWAQIYNIKFVRFFQGSAKPLHTLRLSLLPMWEVLLACHCYVMYSDVLSGPGLKFTSGGVGGTVPARLPGVFQTGLDGHSDLVSFYAFNLSLSFSFNSYTFMLTVVAFC